MNVPKLQQLANRRQELAAVIVDLDASRKSVIDFIKISSWSQVPNIESRFEQVRALFLKINAAREELRTIDAAIVAEVCSP